MKTGHLIILTVLLTFTSLLSAKELSPFNYRPGELIEKGLEEEEYAYVVSGLLRCGSVLLLVDHMMEMSFGEPVFDGNPGGKLSNLAIMGSVKMSKERGSKLTDDELIQSVLNEQNGYHEIYMNRMQDNKIKSGDFFESDAMLLSEIEECLSFASGS